MKHEIRNSLFKTGLKINGKKNDYNHNKVNMIMLIRRLQNSNN